MNPLNCSYLRAFTPAPHVFTFRFGMAASCHHPGLEVNAPTMALARAVAQLFPTTLFDLDSSASPVYDFLTDNVPCAISGRDRLSGSRPHRWHLEWRPGEADWDARSAPLKIILPLRAPPESPLSPSGLPRQPRTSQLRCSARLHLSVSAPRGACDSRAWPRCPCGRARPRLCAEPRSSSVAEGGRSAERRASLSSAQCER